MKSLHMVTFILLVVGGINWGLTAFGYNLVNMLLGGMPKLEMLVYLLVGVSAVYEAATHKQNCKACSGMSGGQSM